MVTCISFQSSGDGGRPQGGPQDEERQRTKSGDGCEGGLLVPLQEAQSFGGLYPSAEEAEERRGRKGSANEKVIENGLAFFWPKLV